MSSLAEIEAAAARLSARQQLELIRFLTERLPQEQLAAVAQAYRTRTHPGGLRREINPDKLGQLPEDY